jgi:ribonuclease Z
MPVLHLLGTGAGFSDGRRTTTMLAFEGEGSTLVVDCGGDVVQRLQAAGIALETITALVVSHEHPDHVAGFPLFMEKLWLSGRRHPIPVLGIAPAIAQARRLWEAFPCVQGWDVPPIEWREIPQEEGAPVWEDEQWRVTASPGVHAVPVVGVRVEHRPTGRACAYSCDTEKCDPIIRLAHGAGLLVHEATGDFPTHSSARQAAEVASEAGAARLVLVHLPPNAGAAELDDARQVFAPTEMGEDGARYDW